MNQDRLDTALAGGLITSPAWAPTLAEFNDILTTITLILGVVVTLGRIGFFIKDRYFTTKK